MTITPVTDNINDNWFGFGERKGSCDEDYDFVGGNVEATRLFIGPWENRASFINAKVLATVVPGENGNNQSITPANAYPDYPSATAYKATVKGLFANGQVENDVGQIKYKYAAITVHYKLFPFGMPGGGNVDGKTAFIEEKVESTTELIPIPYNFDVFDDSPGYKLQGFKKLKGHRDGKLNKVITIEHYKLMIPIVVEPNFALYDFMAGKVNQSLMQLPSGYIVPIESFRYDGFSGVTKREISQGVLAWTVEHNFGFYWPGWNTLPAAVLSDPADAESEVVFIDAPITPPLYDSDELNQILYGENWEPDEEP